MSVERVLWLLDWLPEGSALDAWRQGGPEYRAWNMANTLAAGTLNAANGGNWQRGGGKGRRPTPVGPPKAKTRSKVAGADRAGHDRSAEAKAARRRTLAASRAPLADRPPTDDTAQD